MVRNSNKAKVFFLILALGCAAATMRPGCLSAETTGRTLSGTISSQSGSRIPAATLRLKNSSNGETRSLNSRPDGTYKVLNLPPGTYEVLISAQGFVSAQATVLIRAGADQVANFVLQPDGTAQTRVVEGSSSAVRGVVNSANVSDLPLNGRSASDVAAFEPGVATARTQTAGQAQRGFGTQMTISGARPRQNDSKVDSISVNDYANGPPGSALGVNLGVDAVEQFSVLTSDYPAQYGRSSGGIISASTRSGTNEFHGDVYEFLRNSAFDARNFFDIRKPPFRRNQFGVSLGGPLWKDHTFIFGDYEGLRQSLGITQVDTVPTEAARAGNLSSGPIVVSPNVLRFLNAFYPLPNGRLLAADTGIFTFAGQQVTPENYFTTKVDHKISEHDALNGSYMFDSSKVSQPDELNNKRTGYNARRQLVTVSPTHTFNAHLINYARVGLYRVVASTGLTFPGGNAAAADPSYGTVPGQNAAGVSVPGLTGFTGGLGTSSRYQFHWTSIQAYDDVSLAKAGHSWKFGFRAERIRDNILSDSDPGGVFSFNSLSNLLSNVPFSLAAAIPGTVSERGFRQTLLGGYFQDDWRSRPNLTINLGLRYETASVPSEAQNKLTVLRHITDATPHLGAPLFSNPTRRNFEPRVGFSWDPFNNGKTAINGGFGIFDVLPLPYLIQFNELNSAPFFESANATSLPPGSFPALAFASLTVSSNTFRQAYFDPHPGRNYVMQWNLTLQRELGTKLSAMIAYVGSRGIHQPFRVEDVDIVMPTLTSQGYLWPSPPGSGTRLNLHAGRITAGVWDGDSYYDAMQLRLKKNPERGPQIQASYTWGKSFDTSSGSLVGDEYTNSIASPLWFNPRLNRGLSDFNVTHNLEITFSWQLGTPKWSSGTDGWLLGGWQMGGVFAATSGVPFTPGIGGDTLGVKSTDPNIDLPNVLAGPGCRSLVNQGNPRNYIKTQCFAIPNPITLRGNLGRNTLIGPGLINLDFSIFKNNYIKRICDRFNAQFRVEFFNVLNHANFAPPLDNKNVFDSSGNRVANAGLITSTQTPSRQIQFALKLIW